ncbi:hypothetical protein GCM10027176_30100 [Actinoallomurus bryophytorum]|uniref:Uncharacterized protein n=1 Tax=Actinoallomurus bryophytorum TaxID=1490222 RepID=A0A543CGI9_9ACTN|nr:hypothetical protein [Actinoallomurus bryophytorum]TQL96130.1 hypothetical protein FB559_1651 [Actinoallomurus bryophytorum]
MSATHRADLIAGLHALADYLNANPAVPVPEFSTDVLAHARGTDEEAFAEVDRVAALLGVAVCDRTGRGGHYKAVRWFGPVEYHCVAIPAAVMALHQAGQSYASSVIPDREAA